MYIKLVLKFKIMLLILVWMFILKVWWYEILSFLGYELNFFGNIIFDIRGFGNFYIFIVFEMKV